MKSFSIRIILMATFLWMGWQQGFAQGTTCNAPTPFCSNGLDPYAAGVNTPAAPLGNNYDCLFTQPNPAWFYITASQNGSMDFVLDNTNNVDIDFIVWGPFPDLPTAISQCGGLGNGGASGAIADCSYSGAAVEPVSIANAQAGEVYIMMVTNFSNQPTNIFATANSGTGDYACDCETTVWFDEAPIGFNDGALDDTTATTAEMYVCEGQTMGFLIDVQADSIVDSIGVYLPNTNIGDVFDPADVTVFGPIYPIPGRYDTASFVIQITTETADVGVNNFVFSILNSNCVQDLDLTLTVIGVNAVAEDTSICAGIAQDIQLNASTYAPSGGSLTWTQINGPLVAISNDTIANPVISVPASTTAGDSIVMQVDFTSSPDTILGVPCVSTGFVTIYLVDAALNVNAMASEYVLCQNGLADSVQFIATASGPGIDSTLGVWSWSSLPLNYSADLSDSTLSNPLGLLAAGPGDSISFFVNYNYGACSGQDTVEVFFGDWVADVTPATDTICSGDSISLSATPVASNCAPIYTVSSIPFAPVAITGTPTGVGSCDDCLSGAISMGFDFEFFCNTYSQLQVSSNGFLTFDLAGFSSGCCSGQSLPDPFDPNNLIAVAWEDLNPSSCGSVDYATVGTAPNRQFIVEFSNTCFFGSANFVDVQAILYETSNIIEIHITNIPSGGNIMTIGIENAGGTTGYTPVGLNAADFAASNQAYRFTPQVTFLPTYAWGPATNITSLNTQTTQVFPTANATYAVTVTESGCAMTDSMNVVVSSLLAAPIIACDSSTFSTVSFGWDDVSGAIGYEYSLDGGLNWISTNDTFFTATGLNQGDTVTILVRGIAAGSTCSIGPSATQSCVTDVCNNPQGATLNAPNTACVGSNAFVVANTLSGGTLPYLVDLGGGITDTAYAVGDTLFQGIAPGSYSATLIDLSNGCVSQGSIIIDILDNAVALDVDINQDLFIQCGDSSGAALTVNVLAGNAATYIWSNAETTASISNLSVGNYTVLVSDLSGTCVDSANYTVTTPFNPTLDAWIGVLGQDSACAAQGDVVDIDAGANETGVTYSWSPATGVLDPSAASTQINVDSLNDQTYTITAVSIDSCVVTDEVALCITGFLGLPTAFTPNNDGVNDTFGPINLVGANISRFAIYNRWGKLIFEDAENPVWDGKIGEELQPREAYIYILEYQFPSDPEPTLLRGTVTLIR